MTTNVTHFVLALGALLCGGTEHSITAARRQIVRLSPVILGFMFGCALGAAAQATYGAWSIALPTCLALLTLLIVLRSNVDELAGVDDRAKS
jgi:uncharacterized membrane protein YoaK (UPF0700 family)